MKKFVPLASILLFGLVNEAASSALDLQSELFLTSPASKGTQYATVCFITDTEDCQGDRFEFEKPIQPEICIPLPSETDCKYGRELADDGCKGKRYVCKTCNPLPSETDCKYGTETEPDGCGGIRTICKICTPMEDETNCKYGITDGDDGCGGTRKVCKTCAVGGTDDCQGSETPCASDMVQEVCMDCFGTIKYNCFDPEDEEKVCPQKVYCDPDTKIGVEPSCEDSTGKLFYEKCLAKEICKPESVTNGYRSVSLSGTDVFHLDTTGVDYNAKSAAECAKNVYNNMNGEVDEETVKEKCGLEYHKEKCTTQLGETYHLYNLCHPDYTAADGTRSRCYGYKSCSRAYIDETAKTCECGGETYYEYCLEDTCESTGLDANGGRCEAFSNSVSGYYEVEEKCTTLNNIHISYYWRCDSTKKDCKGNLPPCSGYQDCTNKVGGGVGDSCTCGGITYHESCASNEECDDDIYENGGGCYVYSHSYGGYYEVKETCNGYVAYGRCNSTTPDCEGNLPPCSGKKECYGDEIGVGEPCECGGYTYYDSCEEKETEEVCSPNYNTVPEDDEIFTSGGEYKVKKDCTTDEGVTYYYHASCTQEGKDSAGNTAPCAGYQVCDEGYIAAGKSCTCGGITYHEACAVECNWEDTEESCRIKGKNFSKKCYGAKSNGDVTWYGECI